MARKKSITEKADKAPKTLHDPASEEETEDLTPLEFQDEPAPEESGGMLTLPLKGSASRGAQAKAAIDAAALSKALTAAKKKSEKAEKQAQILKTECLASAKASGKVAIVRKPPGLSLLEPEAQPLLSPQSIAFAVRSECQPLLAEVCATALRQAPHPQIDIGGLLVALVARLQSGQVLGSILTSTQHIVSELERVVTVIDAPAPM
ncbi:hypothetical protein KFL_016460010 [Klebsormidium nitens]|uniref:Uncharacterized protein n=1 Tax=Klebsormidium nitens TaxID=105231 RepID=A0A1Y1IVA8_KLENI|nr:hypothetical protein KFL_016460010 [Klebsormidium nitens]|eukprot:GAQ93559.1 hypothetical protein KFL_016460010 [Klebsormidium nitens]